MLHRVLHLTVESDVLLVVKGSAAPFEALGPQDTYKNKLGLPVQVEGGAN